MSGLYGPPADHAWQAAEAIRGLNHSTIGGLGYEWPSDVDAVIAALRTLVDRMPQALMQTGLWLTEANTGGRVGHDQGEHAGVAVHQVFLGLQAATAAAGILSGELAAVHELSSHLTGTTPDGAFGQFRGAER